MNSSPAAQAPSARRSPSPLALFGGPPAVTATNPELFKWPIVTREDEEATLDVLRRGKMSGTDITIEFEKEFSAWLGTKYALGHSSGTAALQAAMFGVGLGRGDELICPALTYWASCLQVFSLGATVVFADIDPKSWCLDPADIERRITPRTKAIVAVHYLGHPCEMEPIMAIARRRGLKVIEDVSHAQGGHYRGVKLGTIGDVAGISLMTGKSFATGEGGILTTSDRGIYERALAFGHYERFGDPGALASADLKPMVGLPLGGYKYRMHQMSSAMGRVQLKHYDARILEIRKASDYFWSLLEGVPGLRRHQPPHPGSDMAGLYATRAHYAREEVGGLSLARLVEALRAEGFTDCHPGLNRPLHLHPLFNTADVYGDGRPTRSAFSDRDLRQGSAELPAASAANLKAVTVPWFRKFRPEEIAQYAEAFRKVLTHWELLRKDDPGDPVDPAEAGTLGLSQRPR